MKKALIIIFALSTVSCMADTWWKVKVDESGKAVGKSCTSTTRPHVLGVNEYPESYAFPECEMIFWKKVGNDWVEMSKTEKDRATMKYSAKMEMSLSHEVEATLKTLAELTGKEYAQVLDAYKKQLAAIKVKNSKDK
jgi:hypothetical protein